MRALHRKDGGIFTRTRLPDEEQKLSVGLLVDESGSMGWGDRITHARKTAIVLYDFCTSLGIPITIYGHSTDSKGVALYSYAEFDSLDASDRYRLMDSLPVMQPGWSCTSLCCGTPGKASGITKTPHHNL